MFVFDIISVSRNEKPSGSRAMHVGMDMFEVHARLTQRWRHCFIGTYQTLLLSEFFEQFVCLFQEDERSV